MKKFLVFVLPVLFLISSCSSEEGEAKDISGYRNDFPAFQEVLDHCSKKINGSPENGSFGFEKTPEGFFIKIVSRDSGETLHREKVWDFKTKKFQDFDWSKHIQATREARNVMDDFSGQARYFNFYMFYGYGDWYKDVIKIVEGAKKLTLSDYEQLARAYDQKSMNFIRPGIWGNRSTNSKKFVNNEYQKISSKRVKDFMAAADKSLSYYQKIIDKDPSYEAFVIKDVRLKQANNYVHYYNTLLSVKEENKGLKYLKKAKYPEKYIRVAKEYLKRCDQGALLFTDGDNDTFPLWYVQQVKNYRKDVVVANNSLCQTVWYAQMLNEHFGVNMRSELSNYAKNESYFTMIDRDYDSEKPVEINTIIDGLNHVASRKRESKDRVMTLPLAARININNTPVDFDLNVGYLMFNTSNLLDMIENNQNSKCYFASPVALRQIGLDKFLAFRGQVYELTAEETENMMDEVSNEVLEEELALLKFEDFKALPNMYGRKLHYLAIYLLSVAKEDPDRYQVMITEVDEELPDNTFYSPDGIFCLQSKIYMKSKMSNGYLEPYFEAFNTYVGKQMKPNKVTPEKVQEEVSTLYSIITTYENFKMSNLKNKEDVLDGLKALQGYIRSVQASKAFKNNAKAQQKFGPLLTRIDNLVQQPSYLPLFQ